MRQPSSDRPRRREGMRVVYELRDWTGLWLLGQLADSLSL